MRIDIVTLFPAMCEAALSAGVVGRARQAGLAELVITDPRRFSTDRHGTIDAPPYGGGAGMILQAPPVVMAVESVRRQGAPVILMSSWPPMRFLWEILCSPGGKSQPWRSPTPS